jgi:hypothetical protein
MHRRCISALVTSLAPASAKNAICHVTTESQSMNAQVAKLLTFFSVEKTAVAWHDTDSLGESCERFQKYRCDANISASMILGHRLITS